MNVLISVYDKVGIVEFAQALQSEFSANILSTGGTLKVLSNAGLTVTPVEEYTGSPELLGGRVKTLHPKVHGGILAIRSDHVHMKEISDRDIIPIDMVVINLYPFQATVASNASHNEIIEQIDIGGPSMLRSAAKNHQFVTVVPSPIYYSQILSELRDNFGQISQSTRSLLAAETFFLTANYDASITQYLSKDANRLLPLKNGRPLRYGENPHQRGFLYQDPSDLSQTNLASAKILQGKEMSFLNYFDAEATLNIVREFKDPAVALVKHASPCGIATHSRLLTAFRRAYECDKLSAFGVIIALNRECPAEIASEIITKKIFVEVLIAPSFSKSALKLLSLKEKTRLVEVGAITPKSKSAYDLKKIDGGFLRQDYDHQSIEQSTLSTVTEIKPTIGQIQDMLFAWKAVKHTKSNAIVIAKNKATVGIGPGQTSRVFAAMIATHRAGKKAKGAVLASDGFFPFPDSIDEAHKVGISAIIQSGGSINDAAVIARANELKIPMVMTGTRAFKH